MAVPRVVLQVPKIVHASDCNTEVAITVRPAGTKVVLGVSDSDRLRPGRDWAEKSCYFFVFPQGLPSGSFDDVEVTARIEGLGVVARHRMTLAKAAFPEHLPPLHVGEVGRTFSASEVGCMPPAGTREQVERQAALFEGLTGPVTMREKADGTDARDVVRKAEWSCQGRGDGLFETRLNLSAGGKAGKVLFGLTLLPNWPLDTCDVYVVGEDLALVPRGIRVQVGEARAITACRYDPARRRIVNVRADWSLNRNDFLCFVADQVTKDVECVKIIGASVEGKVHAQLTASESLPPDRDDPIAPLKLDPSGLSKSK
jgi:hypothetical protein